MRVGFRTYPRSLFGLYAISFTEHTIKPIRLIDSIPSDYRLEKIEFGKNRIGVASFENGVHFSFPVKWNCIGDSYTFVFNEIPYIFSVKRDLTELGEVEIYQAVDVMSLTDFDEIKLK